MDVIRRGTQSLQGKLLQRLLNKKGAKPLLREDGVIGDKTIAAVKAFQTSQRIPSDGVVGQTTWSRLGITADYTHRVTLFPQPTGMTCWSAAATMVVGNMSVGPGRASLSASGGLVPSAENVREFATGLGWQMHHPQTWSVGGLIGLLRNKPAWAVGGGTSPTGGWLHAIVLSAIWSDGAPDATGTMVRIHDPWPPNVGSIYSRFYRGTVDGFDFISLYVLQPR